MNKESISRRQMIQLSSIAAGSAVIPTGIVNTTKSLKDIPDYLYRWMRSSYYISVIGNPAISVPCAFSTTGLPIGLQIVGRHNADLGVLQMGFAFEQATQIGRRRP